MANDYKEEKVFISGSIEIKEIPSNKIEERLENIIKGNLKVLIGDASGLDLAVQNFFARNNYYNLTVYSIYEEPRNCVSEKFRKERVSFPKELKDKNKKERERQKYKDEQMTKDSDYSFIIWDGKSKGSCNNIIRALEAKKKVVVYYPDRNGQWLKLNKVSRTEVEFIQRNNIGYNASEVIKYIEESNKEKYKGGVEFLKKFLVREGLFVEGKNNEEKTIYRINPNLKKEDVEKYFRKTMYGGREVGINFTNVIIEMAEQEFREKYKCESRENEQQQGSFNFLED